jgi:hypothetical protein
VDPPHAGRRDEPRELALADVVHLQRLAEASLRLQPRERQTIRLFAVKCAFLGSRQP